MKKPLLLIWLCLCANLIKAQDKASVKEYSKAITTYPFSDPNPVPAYTIVYPYFRFDGFTDKPIQKDWKVVELENDYIKLTVLPQIGGKIWSAVEKSTGKPFIYENHVVKFRDIAMRGPWTSGGIEPNYGIIGHTPNSVTPVDYLTRTNSDGSVSCIISVLDLLTRTTWTMEINLPRDKAYFTTRSFWYNATAIEQPYYHWMNTGIKTSGNLEYIFPGNKYIGHEGEHNDWPINKQNGKDLSWYANNNFGGPKSYHVFGSYTDFFGAYWHDDEFGMARYANHDDKSGKKIWIWGLSQQGMIWEKLLTDTDGQYSEVQSGRLFNQTADKSTFTPFKHRGFSPGASENWVEYWYPVINTKGFVEANNYGALNVKQSNNWLKIYFSPVQFIDDTLEVKQGDKVVYSKKLKLSPLKTFIDSVKLTGPSNVSVSLGGNKLNYQSKPDAYSLSRPVDPPKDFDWGTAYGLYLQGKENMDEKQFALAETNLKASLKKDPGFLPALVQTTALMYRNMRYTEGLALAKKALSINTNDGGANYYYGLLNSQLGNIMDAKDGFDVASLSIEYRNAAYVALAGFYLKEKDYSKATEYAAKAINYNRFDINALQIEAIALRKQGSIKDAREVLGLISTYDPINHFVQFENYLLQPTDENKTSFTSQMRSELPVESYFELAITYYKNGCTNDAVKVLQLAPANAMVNYWLAFLQAKPGSLPTDALTKANNSSPAFVFPFRSEDEAILHWAIGQTNNWKPKYYLALLYQSKNQVDKSKALFKQCGNQPGYAPFYIARANMAMGATDLADIKKAIALDSNEWRYNKQLGQYYISNKQYKNALEVVGPFYWSHPDNYIIGMLYAKALLLNNRYDDCSAQLSTIQILPFEGATTGRELYHEAKLMPAITHVKSGDYKTALILIEDARKWPLNLGVGKPYQNDIDERLEDWLTYLCYNKTGKVAGAQAALKNIIGFKPAVTNTISNFLPANHLITAWAIERTSGHTRAANWLNNQVKLNPDNQVLQWCWQQFNHRPAQNPGETTADVRLLQHLISIKK